MWTDICYDPMPFGHNLDDWVKNKKQKTWLFIDILGKFTDVFLLKMNFCACGDNFYGQ